MAKVTKEELAARLNGRQYRDEVTEKDIADAKESGLVIIYGASDDLTEFRGTLNEEESAWDGAKHYIKPDGKIRCKSKDDRIEINAEWCPKDLDCSWRITASVPFAPFDIIENGELYCRGCIIEFVPQE